MNPNAQKFLSLYLANLKAAVAENPAEYPWFPSRSVETVHSSVQS
jgi:hypothetical protein